MKVKSKIKMKKNHVKSGKRSALMAFIKDMIMGIISSKAVIV